MKKFAFFSILILLILKSYAQDIDFYHKNQNDNFSFQNLPNDMSFEEYDLLASNFRMQDMIFSAIVPGYVHFKAKDKITAYSILAVQTVSAATFAYQAYWINSQVDSFKLFQPNLQDDLKTNSFIMGTALFSMGSAYLFDVIHGKYRLLKKQNAIRYKYSMKASFSSNYFLNQANYLSYNFSLKFYF